MVDMEIKPLKELPPINKNPPHPSVIDTCSYDSIDYGEFFNNHIRKNIPCIIKNVGNDWDASKKWVTNDKIDYDYLTNKYGSLTVPVTDCKNLTFDNQPRSEMNFTDYITYLKGNDRDKLLYLKDWHLRRSKPDDKFYAVPPIFGSDWLNEYAEAKRQDDYMFVYIGPTGTWTPLHADVYNSFSWSVNVCGRKKWTLFPPGEERKLRDKFKHVILRFEPEKYKNKGVTYYEVIQGKGDALFVPSGWYHQVENEVDTISINHNWVNGSNIIVLWETMNISLISVQKEIKDLKGVEEFRYICQNMLRNLFGMDFDIFVKLILYIGEKRLAHLDGGSNIAFNNYPLGKNHAMYDLKCIQEVIALMVKHPMFIENVELLSERFILLQDCLEYIF